MEKRAFGKTGMHLTVLGFGGAEIGFERAAQETVNALLNAALDAGLNLIDTAECYANSEELIGNAVAGRREDFWLFTKLGHDGKSFGKPDWDVAMLEASIDRSLQRLKTDHVDLLQLHSCGKDLLEKGDVIGVVERAKKAGKTRFVGYSGDGQAAKYAIETGRFDTLQTSASIFDQESIELTIPLAKARGMGIIAKRPIGNAVWRHAAKPANGYHVPYWERMQVLKYPFLADPVKAAETALRFTLSIPGVTTAIVGTTNPQRWISNAKVVEKGPVPEAEFRAIREEWKRVAKADWVGQV